MATLFVGNLSPDATESDLREAFGAYGEIRSLRMMTRRRVAFVELEDDAAGKAVESLKGTQLMGRTLDIAIEPQRGGRRSYRPSRGGKRRRR